MRTSDLLVDYCWKSQIPKEPSVICDYFGFNNLENLNLILNIYQGLVKYKGITIDELYNALQTQKLNEFIHMKYKNQKNKYYNEFCEKKIIVGISLEPLEDESYKNDDNN